MGQRATTGRSGEILEGRYRLVRLVGENDHAELYEGADTRGAEPVLIALLRAELCLLKKHHDAFTRLPKALLDLEVPNVTRVVAVRSDDTGIPFVVEEHTKGKPLVDLLRRHSDGVPREEAVALLSSLLSAFGHLHLYGVVHGNFHPGHVTTAGTGKHRTSRLNTGTFDDDEADASWIEDYRPPPAATPISGPAPSVDVYALGVLMHHVLTGKLPQPSPTSDVQHGALHKLPQDLRAIICDALQADPEQRIPDAATLWMRAEPTLIEFSSAPSSLESSQKERASAARANASPKSDRVDRADFGHAQTLFDAEVAPPRAPSSPRDSRPASISSTPDKSLGAAPAFSLDPGALPSSLPSAPPKLESRASTPAAKSNTVSAARDRLPATEISTPPGQTPDRSPDQPDALLAAFSALAPDPRYAEKEQQRQAEAKREQKKDARRKRAANRPSASESEVRPSPGNRTKTHAEAATIAATSATAASQPKKRPGLERRPLHNRRGREEAARNQRADALTEAQIAQLVALREKPSRLRHLEPLLLLLFLFALYRAVPWLAEPGIPEAREVLGPNLKIASIAFVASTVVACVRVWAAKVRTPSALLKPVMYLAQIVAVLVTTLITIEVFASSGSGGGAFGMAIGRASRFALPYASSFLLLFGSTWGVSVGLRNLGRSAFVAAGAWVLATTGGFFAYGVATATFLNPHAIDQEDMADMQRLMKSLKARQEGEIDIDKIESMETTEAVYTEGHIVGDGPDTMNAVNDLKAQRALEQDKIKGLEKQSL